MNSHRKLLGCNLIAAIILSLLPFPSLAVKSQEPAPKSQDSPVLVSQLVQERTPNDELSKHFEKYDLIRMDPAAVSAQVRRNGRLVIKSSVRDFDLQMSPYDMFAPDYSAQVIDSNGVAHRLPKPNVTTYKGYVKGLADAQARMSLTERGIEGAILTRQGRYFLQPARGLSKSAGADEFVLYESGDLHKHDGTCGVTLADEVAAQEGVVKAAPTDVIEVEASGPVNNFTPMKIARIATDADGEYVTTIGGASQANAQIATILGFVEGIYESEIGLTFDIVQQNAWSDPNSDPYTSTAASTRLQQFRDHWNVNFPNNGTRSIAHLFTGVNLDGSTIGIASFGVACRNATFSYGLSQLFPFPPMSTAPTAQTVVLTAHEIGHNFGASHTNQVANDVPFDIDRPCEGTIMEANVGNGSAFCPFSRSQIAGHAFGHSSCLIDTANPSPTSQDCAVTPLGGLSANGTLGAGDCRSPSRGVEHFADRYSFNANAGQRVSITMDVTSGDLDPYVFLIGPDGYVVAQDDDGNSGVNSRIPFALGTLTLPDSGTYILEATSFGRLQTGSYSLNVSATGCTINASPSATHFAAAGGSGSVNISLSNCGADSSYQFQVFPSTESWLTVQSTTGNGNQSINFSLTANPNTAGRRAFLLIGGVTVGGGPADIAGGVKIPITQSGTGPDCAATAIAFGQTLNGTLDTGDCHSPVRGSGFAADRYTFNATSGQRVAISTSAPAGNPDTFLSLLGPNGVVLLTDDDSGGGTNSRIPGGNRTLTLGLPGTYTIEVTPFAAGGTGSYSITLTTDTPVADTVQFSQSAFSVDEASGTLDIVVTRGTVSAAGTVNFATTDNFGVQCNQNNGQASARCDFNTRGGTLRFAAGEASKTITLSIVNDGYIEGNENFTLSLSNPSGMTLGSPSTSTITIVDNDATPSNPFENNAFFVRQQYLDFLFREPDTAGFNDWLNVLTNCGPNQGGLGSPPGCDRVHVSSGFFRSTEFGERGYWGYRFYHGTLGRRPNFAEFMPDIRRLSGSLMPAEEEAARAAFIADFMQRGEFTAIYGGLTTAANAAQFIARLEQTAGVTLPATNTTLPGQPPQFGRQELINKMASGEFTAAQTLRAFIEQKVVFDQFFFRAFVAMQYFGYLLRDPEDAGYNDWVDVLTNGRGNIPPGDFRHLIFGFVWSVEYRQRFGP